MAVMAGVHSLPARELDLLLHCHLREQALAAYQLHRILSEHGWASHHGFGSRDHAKGTLGLGYFRMDRV